MTNPVSISYEALVGCSYLLRFLVSYLFLKMAHLNDWPAMALATNIILTLVCLLFFFLINTERVIKENNYSAKPKNPAKRPLVLMGFVSMLIISVWMGSQNQQLSNIFVVSFLLTGIMCGLWLYYDAKNTS